MAWLGADNGVKSFSPVAGIQWVETKVKKADDDDFIDAFQSRCRDSVG